MPTNVFAYLKPGQKINDTSLVRVLDAPLDSLSSKVEYDGSVETAPNWTSVIHFKLKDPQIITTIRFAPLNANNGIVPGNDYVLLYLSDANWSTFEYPVTAEYNYLEFKGVPNGRLYWLRNLSRGVEEMPFFINENGKQQFLYFDFK